MSLFRRDPTPFTGPDKELGCPRDGARLVKFQREAVTLDKCPSCHGLWFDGAELKQVTHDSELQQLAARVRAYAEPSPFACPRCAGPCVASHVDEVEVDTCTLCHGVWLDAGELEEAQRELSVQRVMRDAGGPGFRSFLKRV